MTYKVMVWGSGQLGSMCIREVLERPMFELVGVRTYSPGKDGLDAGAFVGKRPCGVRMSIRDSQFWTTRCDCVLYMARDWGDFHTLAEIVHLLEAGRNVVTPLPYHDAGLHLPRQVAEKLTRACHAGGSTFYATGVNPDVVSSRILPSLMGMCMDVERVIVREVWRCGRLSPDALKAYGFGLPVDVAARLTAAHDDSIHFLRGICIGAAECFGLEVGDIRHSSELVGAPADAMVGKYRIAAGTVVGVSHRLSLFAPEERERPQITAETNWIATDDLTLDGMSPGEHWTVTIDGRPSIRMGLAMVPGCAQGAVLPGSDHDYVATLAACLQAVPAVVAAPAGVLAATRPSVSWNAKLRRGVRS